MPLIPIIRRGSSYMPHLVTMCACVLLASLLPCCSTQQAGRSDVRTLAGWKVLSAVHAPDKTSEQAASHASVVDNIVGAR